MVLGFIGAGNMGGAILKGTIQSGHFDKSDMMVCEKDKAKRKSWEDLLLIKTTDDVKELVEKSDIIILGIKPDGFSEVMPLVAESISAGKILISIAAGISLEYLEGFLPPFSKIIRVMPNTPAMVGEGMSAVCYNKAVSRADLDLPVKIFESIGKVREVTEDLLHCVIGVSASAPAYTYLYIEALMEAAVNNGMDIEDAQIFAAQGVLGAAKMVLETGLEPKQLCLNVCSKGGTTIEAVDTLLNNGFKDKVKEAFQAAVEKSKAMTENKK
ncbi:MAG: pyrroline-5-carboxylate reductase [Anaerovoracaceae bacterium]|nr:pyrroline-5-carboxylate reductase [Clostridiales bacterium]